MLPNASLPPPSSAAEHEDLLRRGLEQGDEHALAASFDSLFPAMLRIAMSHVDTRATAEEIVQETWLAAIRGIDRFESRSSIRTWLFHILRNLARTRGRRDARMRTFSELRPEAADDHAELPVTEGRELAPMWGHSRAPDDRVLSKELAARIESALAILPPRQREVLVLRDVEGWSADEVCNTLGISQTNQRVILHRARMSMRSELEDYLADECM